MQVAQIMLVDDTPFFGSIAASSADEEELLSLFEDLGPREQARVLEFVASLPTLNCNCLCLS